jgi:uncharacterized protein
MDYSSPSNQQADGGTRAIPVATMVWRFLQRSAIARSTLYFGSAVLILDRASVLYPVNTQESRLAIHLTALPFGALLTATMYRIENRAVPTTISRTDLQHMLQGAALGTGAFALFVATAMARGWIAAPAWGWEQTDGPAIVRSLLAQSIGQLATAWNEEMVFRGYGLQVLSAAVGQPAAIAILVPLFAATHPRSLPVLTAQAMAGVMYTTLRLATNDIWVPIGYHWAWNLVQTAILGPADGMPSVRPLEITGPERWVGRPGHPEPGLLTMLVHAAMAVGVGLVGWMRRRHTHLRQ